MSRRQLVKEAMVSIINKIFRAVFPGNTHGEVTNNSRSPEPAGAAMSGAHRPDQSALSEGHALQHRALVYLMTQKTDSIFAALVKTIEKERLKLGVEKMQPPAELPVHFSAVQGNGDEESDRPEVAQILSMASQGETISKIARQLVLPENEVSMVLRLNDSE